MKCDICKCEETYVKKHHHVYDVRGKEIVFDLDRRFCKNCNSLVYDHKLDNEASKMAIYLYTKECGIEKEKIKELRKQYSLSLDDFSKIIGCAKKTLISYEQGNSIPNDIYLVTLKTLLNNPEIIYYLINDNKERFTPNEYDRIINKVYPVIGPNIMQIKNSNSFEATEYNGFTNMKLEKIKNLILLLSENSISKTKLNKELFYIDFLFYKKNACSLTGLVYTKLPFGPVPDDYEKFLESFADNDIIDYEVKIDGEYEKHNIIAKEKYNKSSFTQEELKIINLVKNKFENYTPEQIVNFSHQEKAFSKTQIYHPISYEYALDLNID